MSVFDDLKDSLPGSENKGESSHGKSSISSDLGMSDGQQQSNQAGRKDMIKNDKPKNSGRNQTNMNKPRQQESNQNNRRTSRGQNWDKPNAQAGRPRQGSSRPQISDDTQRKMENAGLNQESRNSSQRRPESVSDQRSDMQQLKAQNEQIIELLKRINQNLNGRNRR